MVGFLLDAKVRRATGGRKSLRDVMRLAYARYSASGGSLPRSSRPCPGGGGRGSHPVVSTGPWPRREELDYADALDWFGLRFAAPAPQRASAWTLEPRPNASPSAAKPFEASVSRGPVTLPPEEPPRFDPKQRRAVLLALSLVTVLASFEATVVSTAMPTIIGELEGLPLYSWVLRGLSPHHHGHHAPLRPPGRPPRSPPDPPHLHRPLPDRGPGLRASRARCRSSSWPAASRAWARGACFPPSLTVTADLYPVRERARVQGLFSTLWGAASLLGPLLGAGMTVAFGWRSIFSINLPTGLLAFALVAANLRESRAPRSDPFDLPGRSGPRRRGHRPALLGAARHGRPRPLPRELAWPSSLRGLGRARSLSPAFKPRARIPSSRSRSSPGSRPRPPTCAASSWAPRSSGSTPSCRSSSRAPAAAPRRRRARW